MPSPRTHAFSLIPHPATPRASVHNLAGHITRLNDALTIAYVLTGDIDRVHVPAPQSARFADELWRHTCCELFIARKHDLAYHECNFAPSREWAIYAFERTRQRAPRAIGDIDALNPHIAVRASADRLELEATIRLEPLSTRYTDATLVLAISAVVEEHDGSLSYWALKHPQAKPDFHHPDAFVLELDEVRN